MHPKDPQITGLIENPSEIPMKDRQLMGDNEHALRTASQGNSENNAKNRTEVNSAAAILGKVKVRDLEERAMMGNPTEVSGAAVARARARKPAKIVRSKKK